MVLFVHACSSGLPFKCASLCSFILEKACGAVQDFNGFVSLACIVGFVMYFCLSRPQLPFEYLKAFNMWSLRCTDIQSRLTEAKLSAEHALAGALQQHAGATSLGRWAGQVTTTTSSTGNLQRYAGVQLSPVAGSTGVFMDVQSLGPGRDLVVVCLISLR